MFYVKEPFSLSKPWMLSSVNDEVPVIIPRDVSELMRNYHVMPVEFLYHNYRKGLKGSILNEEKGMNFPLQTAAFLRAVVIKSALILVIGSQQRIHYWHYHLSVHGKLDVIRLNNKNIQTNFENYNNSRLALLLPFPDLKLVEFLWNYEFFSIIVDDFDEIANKMIFRKLSSSFNIGLSLRNFYKNPDQKLQWKMLNWSNPGCVGKLLDFYEIDNENFRNFRDNYRFWWFRLTWRFCDSFQAPTEEQLNEYENCIEDWTKKYFPTLENERRKRKIAKTRPKIVKTSKDESVDCNKIETLTDTKSKKIRISNNEPPRKYQSVPKEKNVELPKKIKDSSSLQEIGTSESESSSDTVIFGGSPVVSEYVELPSMDENPILTSIVKNLKNSQEPNRYYSSSYSCEPLSYPIKEANCSKSFHQDSVIFSIMDIDQKEGTYCSSKSLFRSQSEDFIISLVQNNHAEKKNENCFSNEIEQVLKEADSVLQN